MITLSLKYTVGDSVFMISLSPSHGNNFSGKFRRLLIVTHVAIHNSLVVGRWPSVRRNVVLALFPTTGGVPVEVSRFDGPRYGYRTNGVSWWCVPSARRWLGLIWRHDVALGLRLTAMSRKAAFQLTHPVHAVSRRAQPMSTAP